VGSLEGTDGAGSGKMVYALADKRCANFKTCGAAGGTTSGTSKINYDLMSLFEQGRMLLQLGECSSVRPLVERIVDLMTVPLIQ
jgi:hypothetical protein